MPIEEDSPSDTFAKWLRLPSSRQRCAEALARLVDRTGLRSNTGIMDDCASQFEAARDAFKTNWGRLADEASLATGPGKVSAEIRARRMLREPLLKVFPAALLGRIQTVPYFPLSDEMLGNIIRLQLGRIKKRIAENHKAAFSFSEAVVSTIASRCTEIESGGRMIDAILTNTILPKLSEEYLRRTMTGAPLKSIALSVVEGDFAYDFA